MKIITKSKRARYNYELKTKYVAGIALFGSEVKSIKQHSTSLDNVYVSPDNKKNLQLINFNIPKHPLFLENHDPLRPKQLLLNKKEIKRIISEMKEKKLTIVPTMIFINDNSLIKVEIYTAKGKKLYDKRKTEKQKDTNKEIKSSL